MEEAPKKGGLKASIQLSSTQAEIIRCMLMRNFITDRLG